MAAAIFTAVSHLDHVEPGVAVVSFPDGGAECPVLVLHDSRLINKLMFMYRRAKTVFVNTNFGVAISPVRILGNC